MTMPTANEQYRDSLIRRQIGLLGLAGSISVNLIEILNLDEDNIRRLIEDSIIDFVDNENFAFNKFTASKLKDLENAILQLRKSSFLTIRKDLKVVLDELMQEEAKFLNGATNTILPTEPEKNLIPLAIFSTAVAVEAVQGKTVKDHIDTIYTQDTSRIMSSVKFGLIQNESFQDISIRVFGKRSLRGLGGATQLTRNNINSVARTSVLHFANHIRTIFHDYNDDFGNEIYTATLDDRTTIICTSLDGQIFPLGVGPQPPIHYNCRSIRVGVFNAEIIGERPAKPTTEKQLLQEYAQRENIGKVAKRDTLPFGHKGSYDIYARGRIRELAGPVPATTTYAEFLERQSVAFQNEVLGKTKAILFREGNLPLTKFVDRRGKEFTLAELAQSDRQAFIDAGLDPEDFL